MGIPVYRRHFKRLFDLLVASTGLVFVSPILFAVAVAIRLEGPGPVLFRQERCGIHGSRFQIFKFRTMYVREHTGAQLTTKGDERVTRVGAFLRRSKIDEIPQLINVIAGTMSIVGPRPEVPRYMSQYSEYQQKLILSVRPGITDFASIYFKNENDILCEQNDPEKTYIECIMPKKFQYYKRYIDEISFLTDINIIMTTIFELFKSSMR